MNTLLIDIIEDAIELELSGTTLSDMKRLPASSLNKLRENVKDFEWGLWARPSAPKESELVHFIPANSHLGINLGATGQGTRYAEKFIFNNSEMNGLLSFALTKYDSIAIETGLGYYLDTTYDLRPSDPSGNNAIRVLEFYCSIAPLLRNETIRIVPSQHRAKFQTRAFSDQATINPYSEDTIAALREEYIHLVEHNNDNVDYFINREQFIAHFLYSGEMGYRPLLNGETWTAAWNAIIDGGSELYKKAKPLSSNIASTSIVIPMLSKLNPADVLALRDDDDFRHFRNAIKNIDTFSSDENHNKLDVSTYMEETLTEAEESIRMKVKGSRFLCQLQDGWLDAVFNVIPSSIVAAQVYPPAQWPMWYSLLTGGITLAGTSTISHAKAAINKRRSSKHLKLISQIRQMH